MAIIKHERSIATVSWIDPVTGLPEVDHNRPTGPLTSRAFLTGNNGYRFCNFLEAYVTYDTLARKVIAQGFTTASRIYRAPSFLGLESHVYTPSRSIDVEQGSIVFTQTIGARTESPEKIGGAVGEAVGFGLGGVAAPLGGYVGRRVGKYVAHSWLGFPPIWSTMRLRVYPDGRFISELSQHSLFPSLTFYEIYADPSGKPTKNYWRVDMKPGVDHYDAVPNLNRWKAEGWGPVRGDGRGPIGGNPWNVQK